MGRKIGALVKRYLNFKKGKGAIMGENVMTLEDLRVQIEDILKSGLGEYLQDAEGDFSILYKSAKVFICPREWADGKHVVQIYSVTNLDVPESPELFSFLIKENFKLLLGHFSYDEENLAVWFEHAVLAEEITRESLITIISAVAIMADKYDDMIKMKFGGILYTEA